MIYFLGKMALCGVVLLGLVREFFEEQYRRHVTWMTLNLHEAELVPGRGNESRVHSVPRGGTASTSVEAPRGHENTPFCSSCRACCSSYRTRRYGRWEVVPIIVQCSWVCAGLLHQGLWARLLPSRGGNAEYIGAVGVCRDKMNILGLTSCWSWHSLRVFTSKLILLFNSKADISRYCTCYVFPAVCLRHAPADVCPAAPGHQ